MKAHWFIGGLLLVCLGAGSGLYGVKLSFFKVEDEAGRNFVLTWQAEQETSVRHYEVLRRTIHSNGVFIPLKTLPAHGPNKPYTFRDDQVYKTAADQVDYQLEVVFENGLRQILASKSVNYTPTAIRRTWGSIKAMFQ